MGMLAAVLVTALAANVQANKAPKPTVTKSSIKAPSAALDDKKEDEEVNLGSTRAKDKGKRSSGRRKLMADQVSSEASPTGLQI